MKTARESYRHGNLAESLITDALELLATTPMDQLSMRLLADRANVSPRAPYVHFRDRQDLLRAVAHRGFKELNERMRSVSGGVFGVGEVYVNLAIEKPNLFRLMFSGIVEEDQSCGPAETSFDYLVECIHRVQPSWSEAELQSAAVALWSFVHGIADLRIDGLVPEKFWTSVSVTQLGKQLAAVLGQATS